MKVSAWVLGHIQETIKIASAFTLGGKGLPLAVHTSKIKPYFLVHDRYKQHVTESILNCLVYCMTGRSVYQMLFTQMQSNLLSSRSQLQYRRNQQAIGRERKVAVEKKQAHYQSQVSTGNTGRLGH